MREDTAASEFGMAEGVVLLTMSLIARIFLTFPRSLVEEAGTASWISSLLGLGLALVQVRIIYLLLKPHPEKNIVDITGAVLGKIAGTMANIIYAAFFVAVGALFTRNFSEALLLSALPRTPISVVSIGYIAVALLGAWVGLEAMARSARVTYPFVVAGMAVLLLSLIPQWDFTQLFPLLGKGPAGVMTAGLEAGGIIEILLAGVLVKSFHGAGNFGKITARAMAMGFAWLILLELVLVLTLGHIAGQESTLPFYQLSRLIYLGRYFQRIESIFIIIWGYVGMVKVALTLYCAAVTLAWTFKLPDHRPLVWPLALVVFVVSLLPLDLPATVRFEAEYLRLVIWFPGVLIPVLALAVDRVKKKGGAE